MLAVRLLFMHWNSFFADEDTETMILVDASNALNYLNRQVTLLNCGAICPALSHILVNTTTHASLSNHTLQRRQSTQGDPLTMAMYAVGTQPLIHKLDGIARQVWHADNSATGSTLEKLRKWWDLLVEIGPLYGYFLKGSTF